MIKERDFGFRTVKTIIDLIMVEAFYYAWFFICKTFFNFSDLNIFRYSVYANAIGLSFVVKSSFTWRLDLLSGSQIWFPSALKALSHTLFSTFCIFLLLIASKDSGVSRFFLFTFFPVMFFVLTIGEVYLPKIISVLLFKSNRMIRTVIVGSGVDGDFFCDWIKRQSLFGVKVIGRISVSAVNPSGSVCSGAVDLEEIRQYLDRLKPNQMIVSDLVMDQNVVKGLNMICDKIGVRIIFKFSSERLFGRLASVNQDGGLIFAFPQDEPLENPFNRIVKRLLDLVVAIPVVALIIPVSFILVKILQKVDSPGPVFYRQQRCGINNVLFEILKYRTMHVGNYDVSRQAGLNDTRISKYGKWLRKTSVDELPQFINVLKGEMSVVGPRPHLEAHNLKWAESLNAYQKRSYVKPGITGLAQVRGLRGEARSADDIRLRIESDLEYVEGWSFWLDCKIIIKTIIVVFFPPKTAV
jgi:exopolysaccharide biosynthesis polyprenyl glycosylphosphotransferase